jgi:hypothetical protein
VYAFSHNGMFWFLRRSLSRCRYCRSAR